MCVIILFNLFMTVYDCLILMSVFRDAIIEFPFNEAVVIQIVRSLPGVSFFFLELIGNV